MNYDEITSTLIVLAGVPRNSEDSNYQKVLPAAFHYAEGRIYRELSFLATDIITPVPLVAMTREQLLPENILSVRSVSICTPPGAVTSNSRRFYPERVSPEAVDMFWPQPNFKPGVPKKYAIIGVRPPTPPPVPSGPPVQGVQPAPLVFFPERFIYALRLMPSPDRAYTAEVYGGVEPALLSQSNPETFLSTKYPELLIACCMVFITGYQRDYGAQADDPQRAVSWEAQYTALRAGIALEAGEMRGEGPGFTALPPAQLAQQPRSP
jgi:hypothetical protein